MNTYQIKVITKSGMWTTIDLKANTYDEACRVALNMYGPGASIGSCIQTSWGFMR